MPKVSDLPENLQAAFTETTLLSAPKLATLLGIDVKTLRKHVENGDLPGRIKGSGAARQHWVFTIKDVAEFLKPRASPEMKRVAPEPCRLFKSSGKPAPRSGMPRRMSRLGPI